MAEHTTWAEGDVYLGSELFADLRTSIWSELRDRAPTIDLYRRNLQRAHVDMLATAIVPAPGIALGIFVGENRTRRFEHGFGDDVLGRDQLDFIALATEFSLDGGKDLGITLS